MISVIICTYNRAELVGNCLQALIGQSLAPEHYEIIVVDNNSIDHTQQVVNSFIGNSTTIKICTELKPGANHARNKGAAYAIGDYLAFIDDDAIAEPDWLLKIHEFLHRRPEVVLFGGPYDAYTLEPRPDWFPPEYGSLFLGEEERPIQLNTEWITGTNLIVKKSDFFAVGGFHPRLGSVEEGVFYFGEETRLQVDLRARGHIPYYVPSVRVKHLVRKDKMSLCYLLRSYYLMGRNHGLTFRAKRTLLSHGGSMLATGGKAVAKLSVHQAVPLKRKLYYALYPFFYELGAFVEYFKRNPDET